MKLGNYPTVQVEPSRIITYGRNTDEELENLKKISGIKKVEESTEKSNVKFTIIIGIKWSCHPFFILIFALLYEF